MHPDPDLLFPLAGYERLCFLKNLVQNPLIEIGDFTYYDDFEDVHNFEKQVKYHFPFTGDKLIIGRYGMIASGASFIMNGANHLTDSFSSYPFAIFGKSWAHAMDEKQYPHKGDLIVGHDVWIGHGATLMAGIEVGHGAIIAVQAVVVKDVPPYTIVGGNPAKPIRTRFDPETIEKLLRLQWWFWPPEKVAAHVHELTAARHSWLDDMLKMASETEG